MKDNIYRTLDQYKKEIEAKQNEILQIEEDPLIFFTHLVQKRESLIPQLLLEKDQEDITEYQNWLYPKVIQALKDTFNITEFTITYNVNQFPSPIYFSIENKTVAMIHPYEHVFEYVFPSELKQCIQQRRECYRRIAQLEEELSIKELTESNPILIGKGSAWKTTQVLLTKNKVKEELKREALVQLEEVSRLNREMNELNLVIKKQLDQALLETMSLERLSRRFEDRLQLATVNPYDRMEEEEEEYEEEIVQMRILYRKELLLELGLDENWEKKD